MIFITGFGPIPGIASEVADPLQQVGGNPAPVLNNVLNLENINKLFCFKKRHFSSLPTKYLHFFNFFLEFLQIFYSSVFMSTCSN